MADSAYAWIMTKQYIENQQRANIIKASLTKKPNPIMQSNNSCCDIRQIHKQHSETIRYFSNIKPIDDLNKKPIRKMNGKMAKSTSNVLSPKQSMSIKETRRKDLRSLHEAKNHLIRINKIKTINCFAKEDHLESNMIPLSSASPANKGYHQAKNNNKDSKDKEGIKQLGIPSEEYKRINSGQLMLNMDRKGKKTNLSSSLSTFNHLFNQKASDTKEVKKTIEKDYQIEKIHKKKSKKVTVKGSINSLIKYDYGKEHMMHNYEYTKKPNSVKYNTLLQYHSNK